MHLHRAKYVPKGGPDGGDGGRGGHIILRANPQKWTLIHLRYRKHVKAEDGEKGGAALCKGKNGPDVILEVPVGTVAKDAETGEMLFELLEPGEERILCRGGRGGLGNNNFKSATNQTPRYAQPGEEGEEGWFILELKVLADVGLVGFPNAGKSTLLATITSAKPKIANYAFTTLEPNLGIVSYYDEQSFVMADIPGIIEGAHEGKGIGIRFLRHIERNSVLLFMVSAEEDDIKKGYETLLNELREYNPELLVKEQGHGHHDRAQGLQRAGDGIGFLEIPFRDQQGIEAFISYHVGALDAAENIQGCTERSCLQHYDRQRFVLGFFCYKPPPSIAQFFYIQHCFTPVSA